jgi:hypothetical protein
MSMDAATEADRMLPELIEWVAAGVPVMRATALELARLETEQERISGNALAAAILRDPLLTLRVIRFLYSHRTRSQTVDITTIAHAIMMLGQARFFREFSALPLIEERLQDAPEMLAPIRQVASQARLAALFARDWAHHRHDMDPEEIMVAALLHHVDELMILLRYRAPGPLLTAAEASAWRARLFEGLGLPGLLRELNEEDRVHNPRVVNVRLACQLARRCAHGWHDPLLAEDLELVQRFLHVSAPEAWGRVRRVTLQAAREWHFYATLPAAAYLPLIPEPDETSTLPA